jgi:hypothetical protein
MTFPHVSGAGVSFAEASNAADTSINRSHHHATGESGGYVMSASIALPLGIRVPSAYSPGRWERSLARREVFALDVAERLTVSCLEGMLWVTLSDDSIDYVLAPGQALRVPAGARLVVEGLALSRFGVARG